MPAEQATPEVRERVSGPHGEDDRERRQAQGPGAAGDAAAGVLPDGDAAGQAFALTLGCAWAGGSSETPPQELDAAIIFATVGSLVPQALRHVRKGGRVVCAGL